MVVLGNNNCVIHNEYQGQSNILFLEKRNFIVDSINCILKFSEQTNVLELLHYLTSNSKVVFSENNNEEEFVTCLTHWLLVVGLQDSKRKNSHKLSLSDLQQALTDTGDTTGIVQNYHCLTI